MNLMGNFFRNFLRNAIIHGRNLEDIDERNSKGILRSITKRIKKNDGINKEIPAKICGETPAEILDEFLGISLCNPAGNCEEMSASTGFLRNLRRSTCRNS